METGERGGGKCDLESGLLNVYGCSEAAAPTAGHTQPLFICLCKSFQRKLGVFLFFFPLHNSLTFLRAIFPPYLI